jgi:hypothetical protein
MACLLPVTDLLDQREQLNVESQEPADGAAGPLELGRVVW